MDPLTTAAITTVITHWGGKAFEKVFDTTVNEVAKGGIDWFKKLFTKEDGTLKDAAKQLQEKPDSAARRKAVEAVIEEDLEENPANKQLLHNLAAAINMQNNSTGNTITQTHHGTGDNIGGNKIENHF